MKKPFLIMLCGLIAIISACSKKSNPTPISASIVGKWAVKGDTSREYTGEFLASTYVIPGINSPWYQFNADGTGSMKFNISLPDDTLHFTYRVSHDSLYFVHPNEVIRGRDYATFSYQAAILLLNQHNLITINKFGTSPNYIEDEYFTR
ncbi:MAG: hypothetical protein ABI203_00770 [Mucilaginibacter sp.]